MSEGTIRLNRYLAMCGVGARRKVEEFITAGRVRINGETVTEPGRQVAPGDVVELDGRELSPVEPTYLIFNKPKGVLSAVEDSRERTLRWNRRTSSSTSRKACYPRSRTRASAPS